MHGKIMEGKGPVPGAATGGVLRAAVVASAAPYL